MRGAEWLVDRPWRPLLLAVLVITPLLVVGEFDAVETRERVRESEERSIRSLAQRTAEILATRVGGALDQLAGAATVPGLKSTVGVVVRTADGARDVIDPPDSRELSLQLAGLHALMRSDVEYLLALDGSGTVLTTDPPLVAPRPGTDMSGTDYMKAVANRQPAYVGVDPFERTPIVAVPLLGEQGQTRGALVAFLKSTAIQTWLRSLTDAVAECYLFDHQGRLLAWLNGEQRRILTDLRGEPAVASAMSGKPFVGDSRDPFTEESALMATWPVGDLGWNVMTLARPEALRREVEDAIGQQRALRLGLAGVLLLGAALVGTSASAAIQRRRESVEALERQTATSSILNVISRSPADQQPTLDAIVESGARLCDADMAFIYVVEQGFFKLRAGYKVPAAFVEYTNADPISVAPHRGSLSGRVVAERRAVQIPDVLVDAEYSYLEGQRLVGYRSMLNVPMFSKGELIGLIGLWRTAPVAFTAKQIDLMSTFADQAVIAIENTRLFNETKDALAQQTAVAQVMQAISSSAFDLTPIFDVILKESIRLCAADAGWVAMLIDEEQVKMVAALGHIDDQVKKGDVFRPSGMALRVRAARATVHDPTFSSTDYWGRTRLGVPLLHDNRVIGLIVLGRDDYGKPFTDRQIQLVETFAKQAVIAIENVRLFGETTEALERQTATADVLRVIAASPTEVQPVLDAIADRAMRLCAADGMVIRLLDGNDLVVVARAGTLPGKDAVQDFRIPMRGDTLTGAAMLEARTIHVADVQASNEYPRAREMALRGRHRTVAAVPLLREGRAIGVFSLARQEVKPYSEKELVLVATFADQAVIAIENVRLFKETKEALERQTAIGEVLNVISRSTDDVLPVMDIVLSNAVRLCDADFAWMRWSHRGFVEFASAGRTRELTEQAAAVLDPDLPRDPATDFSKSIMGRTLETRSRLHVEDITADPELYRHSGSARKVGARTVVAVPVFTDEEMVAVLVLARRSVRAFTDRELEILQTFADQGAIAVRNVRQFTEIQDKSGQLEVASRHKSEFLANMSHELRTPLNAIIGFSEVLIQGLFGDLNEKQREYLQDVIGSGQHLLSLINDILDLSKIEAGRMELELSTFAFRSALESGMTIVRERAARHAITLNVDVSDDLGQVEADERKVKQVFYNLLSNAVKFTPDGGRVEVSVRQADGDVRVEVRDNGIGIAEDDQARIFEEFQQVGRERSREGTGLGLTLTKRFVELHGGRIWVESAPGEGSTFAFTLPLRQAEPVRA